MNKHAIFHILDVPYVYGIDKDNLIVRIRTAKGDMESCIIHYKDRYDWENSFDKKEMKLAETDALFDYYEVKLHVKEQRYRYYFELIDRIGNIEFLNERGVFNSLKEPREQESFQFPYLNPADVYDSPSWAYEGIVYQVFPDRFYNGDKTNDPKDTSVWGDKVTAKSMFGGDLQGITDKLDYLEELGVNILYLTPIFESSTNHKYNTKDYFKIDASFGDIEKVRELIDKCHMRGIKIIFDAVFNHCGNDFFAFEDVVKNGEKSKYKDWFYIHSYPVDQTKVNYLTFANNVSSMPKLNTENPEVVEYLLRVAEYWIKEVGIDGWRLDVCDEVDHAFWREFRKIVKRSNPNAIIIGEIMHEASAWLKGDQMDSIMNYPIKNLSTDFFAKRMINAEEFSNGLTSNRVKYMKKVNMIMFNLIGSHDTSRFLTECDEKIERLKLAAAFQYTYIGMPYIYYGDEVGMAGGNDPDCRKCMIWDENKQNKDLLNFYISLNKIRKENKTLMYGEYRSVYKKDYLMAYKRVFKNEEILIILNNSDVESIINSEAMKGNYIDLLNNKTEIKFGNIITLKANEVKILKLKK